MAPLTTLKAEVSRYLGTSREIKAAVAADCSAGLMIAEQPAEMAPTKGPRSNVTVDVGNQSDRNEQLEDVESQLQIDINRSLRMWTYQGNSKFLIRGNESQGVSRRFQRKSICEAE
jgi:hypothetical protein